jgi:hypothetical protein
LFSDSVGQTEIGNSIVSGFDADWCGDVESLGHNLVDNPDCTFNSDGDIVGQPADMLFVPVEADWNPGGREVLRHALVPLAESRAIDSGGPYACSSGGLVSQLRNPDDGDGDGISACDRGAVERIPSTVDKGGINGLYFNPDADGHYVYIAETTHNTMVMWTTFDSRGKQAWIFGIGDEVTPSGGLVGFLLPTDAYINLNGKVRLDGTLKPAESLPWGTITVRMTSCNQGRLIYESNRPGFGSGQFEFERLAFINQVGCVEGR